MRNDRLLLDTVFIEALLNQRDQYHQIAVKLFPRLRSAREVWITEAILTEVGNAFSRIDRKAADQFIQQCYRISNIKVVTVDTPLFQKALTLYRSRNDQTWGLTDCISFVVMAEKELRDAMTADRHFIQAGYRALMLDCDF